MTTITILVCILCIVLFITSLILCIIYKTRYENFDDIGKIDIVVTWVELNKNFQDEKQMWLNKETNKKFLRDDYRRYTDHQELKYLLRSVEKYFKKFNNIYLVVKDGQFPNYLKKQHSRLKIINHSQIIPKEYLPTFNSFAIECYIHHIPNLTKNYIYMNDDFMFLKACDPSYFLENNIPVNLYTGKPYPYTSIKGDIDLTEYMFLDGLRHSNKILDKLTITEPRYEPVSHTPQMYNKNFDFEIENRLKNFIIEEGAPNVYDSTGMSKFRKNNNLYLVPVVKGYLYKYWFNSKFKETDSLVLNLIENISNLDDQIGPDKKFLCIEYVDDNNTEKYFSFMNKLFPDKSTFEE